jgi:hypothetical protein
MQIISNHNFTEVLNLIKTSKNEFVIKSVNTADTNYLQ